VRLPEGIDEAKLRTVIRDRYGVMLSSGRAETFGKLIRIGHMGPTARPIFSLVSVAAVAGGFQALGVGDIDIGRGVSAAMKVMDSAS
jgi:pyridoxamine--pyruvate transaminase